MTPSWVDLVIGGGILSGIRANRPWPVREKRTRVDYTARSQICPFLRDVTLTRSASEVTPVTEPLKVEPAERYPTVFQEP